MPGQADFTKQASFSKSPPIPRIATVGVDVGAGCQYKWLADALSYIAGQTHDATHPWVILLYPDLKAESNLLMLNYVDLVGLGPEACQIVANDAANPIITAPNGVTCTIQGVRVENTNTGAAAILATGATLTIRKCFLRAAGAAGALRLTTTASTVTVQDSYLEGTAALYVTTNVAHTLLAERSRLKGSNYLAFIAASGPVVTFLACDGMGAGTLYVSGATIACKQCSRWGASAHVDFSPGSIALDHCDCGALDITDGGTITAKASSVTTIEMNSAATASLTMDDACEISGAITDVHASATLRLPRKKLSAGSRAPGLLATGTQMDSVNGAGAAINQAPADRETTDSPRSVQVVHTGAASAFPYDVTLSGYDNLKGILVLVTEVISVTGAGTFHGVKAWNRITNWATSGVIAANDTVALQFDDRMGLEHRVRDASHLLYCYKSPGGAAPVSMPPASFTLDLDNYTIRETGVAVVAGDGYEYVVVKG